MFMKIATPTLTLSFSWYQNNGRAPRPGFAAAAGGVRAWPRSPRAGGLLLPRAIAAREMNAGPKTNPRGFSE